MRRRPERNAARLGATSLRTFALAGFIWLAACLCFAQGAMALSIAPKAAEEGCKVEEECVTTQPSTPAWLTLAGGKAFLTQQTLDGTAANEYGTSEAADTTLYGSAQAYAAKPESEAAIVDSVLANLAGNGTAADTYNVVLREDRTVELLGSQSQGYANLASATVPVEGELDGVLALAASSESKTPAQVVVVTSAGFYFYNWKAEKPSTLSLASSTPSALPGVQAYGDRNIEHNNAFTCVSAILGETRGNCEEPRIGEETEWKYEPPTGAKTVSVYQAPVSRGEYEADEAAITFAIAYVVEAGEPTEYFYHADFFAYEPNGQVHLFGELESIYASASEVPEQLRYAISRSYLRAATLTPAGKMQAYDVFEDFGDVRAEERTASCPKPSEGAPAPLLAVEAIEGEPESLNEEPVTGASLCAAIQEGKIHYQLQRTDAIEVLKRVVSTSKPGTITPPAGSTVKAIGGTLDFPCDQFLYQFAKHPTPDGYPETGSGEYCAPIKSGEGVAPFKPEVGAAGLLAAQFQYIAQEEGGTRSLRQASIAYEPEASRNELFSSELETEPKSPSSEYEEQLASLSGEGPAEVQMLPLDPAGIEWADHLLESEPGEVLREPATSNPVPVTVMAAPPYYSGAEQQVTPTATTFSNSECEAAGAEQSNTVGLFAGFDGAWAGDKYEFEALAKTEASWTQETEIENCSNFDQEFIAGNFGNNFVADNSLLFRVDTGSYTYLDLTSNSLGIGVTDECTTNDLKACDAVFVPSGSQYALQTMTQLRHPRPNNFYAKDDKKLYAEYGASLEEQLPRPGNPATYPSLVAEGTAPEECAGPPSGPGSGNTGVIDVNPFVAPKLKPPPNLLEATQASEVNPASGGEEGGTVSSLEYESSKQKTSSTQFSAGIEITGKIKYLRIGAEYSHTWGSSMTESFASGTSFSGGVFDFSGFYDPYSYRLYECKGTLTTSALVPGASSGVRLPVFFVDYMAELSPDELPLNFVTSSASLPEGTAGQEYAGQVFASGGSPAYTYEISGGGLPPGLELAEATGQISGTPTTPGTYEFTLLAEDSLHNRASEEISITIAPELGMPSTLEEGKVGLAYEQSLGATGGTPPYTYLLTKGTPPPGLHFNNTAGALQGTPTEAGTFCFTVYVADSAFPQGTLEDEVCVTIADSLALSPSSTMLPEAVLGERYEIAFKGSGGYESGYTYEAGSVPSALCALGFTCLEGEGLPEGLSLKVSGGEALLEGTPTAEGSYEFTISLSDEHGGSVVGTYKVEVNSALAGEAKPASFSGSTSATVGTGEEVDLSIECEGSPAPTVSGTGSLPSGLSFDAEEGACGAIVGTAAPGTGGEYELLLEAQNGLGSPATETFTVIVHEGPEINEQPEDQTATAPGGSATFVASATGVPTPTAIWEVSTDGGATWSKVSEASHYHLELEGVEAGENGYEYRAKFENAQGSVRSKPATLTVQFAPAIEVQPEDATAIEGASASFAASAAGQPAAEVQWQLSTDGGETWTDISGATKPTLAFGSVSAKDQGDSYRAVFTNLLGKATTEAATLTVQTPPQVLSQPVDETATAGGSASFHASASGGPAPTVQWMVSTDGGIEFAAVKGATSDTLRLEAVSASENGNRYEAVFSNPAGEVSTVGATLTVQVPPAVSLQPAPATIAVGGDATFTAQAGGRPAPTVQWQLSTDGGRTWTDISEARSPSLALLGVPAADSGQLYRAVFSNAAGTATTKPALLTVQSAPGLTAAPSGTVGTAGGSATFTVGASGSPPPSIQWEVSEDGGKTWVPVPGATQATLQLERLKSSQSGFLYRALVTNSRGTVITKPVTLFVSAGRSGSGKSGPVGSCRRAPKHLPFRNRKLGRVIRYKVLVDGRQVSAHHGHDLRHAVLPKLGRGWHAVKIVSFTSRGFRISTRRVYFGCAQGIAVSKRRVRRRHHGHRHGAHRRRHGHRRHAAARHGG